MSLKLDGTLIATGIKINELLLIYNCCINVWFFYKKVLHLYTRLCIVVCEDRIQIDRWNTTVLSS